MAISILRLGLAPFRCWADLGLTEGIFGLDLEISCTVVILAFGSLELAKVLATGLGLISATGRR